ncbi:hypothetical protein COCC4DRAFT_59356 [Bipolaris maydis ATCC 48331]|uniref:Uncharacterized protein n=2 Tax=Cochliobolus heterostrophus TaxID=5016 RepID=M2UHM3_COCH5|nr:uncharacterized protein COCC4DRAFT_59356 [Bipolaris maydis ATCC 48331]EMD87493.1 hypothetical protein COCHEDRAFT_1159773 [Bipolaris maydis C5]ENI06692.1 hypothetical protein COCC4DRAFT_59356 [Bipolaris maydis ATCC 48331]KAJ6212104.1 hypothetical protein PSV09DRAFT_1159773 [Bipolaris maydis]
MRMIYLRILFPAFHFPILSLGNAFWTGFRNLARKKRGKSGGQRGFGKSLDTAGFSLKSIFDSC